MLAQLLLVLLGMHSGWQQSLGKPPSFPGLPTVREIVSAAGYEETDVEVMTEDGYSLWMHRIGNNNGTPVIIQHGVLVAAESWISRGPNKDLVFYLLEEGLDVWLPNQRGTVYNQYSLKYNRSDPRFWDFSFHESGLYDLPAIIDNILQIRRTSDLFYIGHSLGTTVYLVMASMRPEYNSKVRAAILLSPVAFAPSPEEFSPLLHLLLVNADHLYRIMQKARMYEVFPRTVLTVNLLKKFCGYQAITQPICLDVLGIFLGENRLNIDKKDYGFQVPYTASGTSSKTLLHIAQLYQTGEFKQFDYGRKGNLDRYGSVKPPKYNLGVVSTPVALYWSVNDPLISEKSVKTLGTSLPNLMFSKCVPDPLFSHADMYLGKNAHEVIYSDIITLLKSSIGNSSERYMKPFKNKRLVALL